MRRSVKRHRMAITMKPRRITLGTREEQQQILRELRRTAIQLGADEGIIPGELQSNGTEYGNIHKISLAFEEHGADKQLLATVGSWGDTLDPKSILELLQDWNEVA